MIDPFDSQFKYVRNADLVVTENGSTGWEGLILRRPTLLLADTFYDGTGLGRRVRDPDDLGAAILDLLGEAGGAGEDNDAALANMIDAERETSFPVSEGGAGAGMEQLGLTVAPRLVGPLVCDNAAE